MDSANSSLPTAAPCLLRPFRPFIYDGNILKYNNLSLPYYSVRFLHLVLGMMSPRPFLELDAEKDLAHLM